MGAPVSILSINFLPPAPPDRRVGAPIGVTPLLQEFCGGTRSHATSCLSNQIPNQPRNYFVLVLHYRGRYRKYARSRVSRCFESNNSWRWSTVQRSHSRRHSLAVIHTGFLDRNRRHARLDLSHRVGCYRLLLRKRTSGTDLKVAPLKDEPVFSAAQLSGYLFRQLPHWHCRLWQIL